MLSQEQITYIAQDIQSYNTKVHLSKDFELFQFYNGATKEIIKSYIMKEFRKPETVEEMIGRLVPLNFLKKIINKLAGVYVEAPVRRAVTKDVIDIELLSELEDALDINNVLKTFNRYYKLNKRACLEIFVENGHPALRLLPAHTYKAYSFDKKNPTKADAIVKIMKDDLFLVWTKEEHFYLDTKGNKTAPSEDNLGMINPYGVLPFFYRCDSVFDVMPVMSDDMMSMSVAIPVALTDLMFGLKYQAWPIIYTVGVTGEITGGPQAIYQLQREADGSDPKVGVIAPQFDAAKILDSVKFLLDAWLSTNNLSNNYSGSFGVGSAVSGVSKMLDQAESIEDKKDQQGMFFQLEAEIWDKLKENFMPYWRATNELEPDLNREFSSDFEVYLSFKEPQAFVSEKDRVDIAKAKLDSKLSSRMEEIQKLNPDYDEEMIYKLIEEINQDQGTVFGSLESNLQNIPE